MQNYLNLKKFKTSFFFNIFLLKIFSYIAVGIFLISFLAFHFEKIIINIKPEVLHLGNKIL